MSTPRVSIVIPVFNGEAYLAAALEGVLAQTFRDWELLLIDDGSWDGSPHIAARFASAHPDKIRCFSHSNCGQFATRLRGAREARSDTIALLDQDDVWDRDYLERHFEVYEDSGASLSYGPSRYWFTGEPERDFTQPAPEPGLYEPGALLGAWLSVDYANTPCPSCALLRREVFAGLEKFGKLAKGSMYEDQYLWWHAASRWPVAVHATPRVKYRQHDDSSVAKFEGRRLSAEINLLRVMKKHLDPTHPIVAGGAIDARLKRLRSESRHALLSRLPPRAYRLALSLYRAPRRIM